MSKTEVSRRIFLMGASIAMAGCATTGDRSTKTARIPSLKRLGYQSPNGKLNVAAIGSGGKGSSDIGNCADAGENIVALCDVDWDRAADTFRKFPDAKKYKDYREMLDKEKHIDACTVSTPDHTHAPAAMACIRRGIHVYVQKPLTHTVYEARELTKAAREYKVATQMGNQGHSGEGVRQLCEMVWDGAIGPITEAHIWTNRPVWPQGVVTPLPKQPTPETMDWNLWLGTAPERPYNKDYAPFNWRGWWDFGCGALGDMGCHIMDPANWALRLGTPISIECLRQDAKNDQTAPTKSIVKYEFPARYGLKPVTVYWYDGGLKPPRPAGAGPDTKLGDGDNGSYFVGEKGVLTTGEYGGDTRFVSDEMNKDYKMPQKSIPRSFGHTVDWLQACKGGVAACSNFDYSGPFSEVIVLGNLSLRCPGKLLWDAEKMEVTNNRAANEFVTKKYRKGWGLDF